MNDNNQEDNNYLLEQNIGINCFKDCLFCNEGGIGLREYISFDLFKGILDNKNYKKVIFSGGEPLSNIQLLDYINFAHQKGLEVGLVTAWKEGFGQEFIEKLVLSGLDELMISLEGPELIHDYLTKSKGAFNNIIKALVILGKVNKGNMKVIIQTNINRMNYSTLLNFISFILLTFPYISIYHIQILEPIGSALKNKKLLFGKYNFLLKGLLSNFRKLKYNNKIKFGRIPYCVLGENNIEFSSITPNRDVYKDIVKNDSSYSDIKYHSTKCNKCIYNISCEKFFSWYIKEYGDIEIIPFLK